MELKTAAERPERPPALGSQTMCEAFQTTARAVPDETAVRTKGDEFSCTWSEYAERARRLAGGFAGLGLERGDTLAIMLTNRPEFHFVDAAAMHLGATPFSIYNTYAPEQIEHLLRDSGARIAVTEAQFADRIVAAAGSVGSVEHVVVVDGGPEGTLSLADVEAAEPDGFDFEATWRAVEREDVITLIYTSGTTGPPKGVELTHRNLLDATVFYDRLIGYPLRGRVVSYLPMAHVAERNVSHYLPMMTGFSITCCPDPRQVAGYLAEVHPTWFFAVPRVWEKLKAGLEAMLAGLEDAEQRERVGSALELSLRRVRAIQSGAEVPEELERQWRAIDDELFSNLRAMLGLDQLYACHVGGAPTPPEVVEFFHALGVPLAEGWGMSETTGVGCMGPRERIRIGTVGPPAPGIEMKLGDDGELLVKSSIVMRGYRNQPEKTRETFTDDGWLRTGDIAEIDDDGYVRIVDRKKELIINAAGKNMSPANIEAKLKSAGPLIGQAIAIGDERPYNVALITLDPDALGPFRAQHGIDSDDIAALVEHPAVREQVEAEVQRANEGLARVEQIKRFTILPAEWLPGGDELTPTMKLKRRPIADKYAREIEELYAS